MLPNTQELYCEILNIVLEFILYSTVQSDTKESSMELYNLNNSVLKMLHY